MASILLLTDCSEPVGTTPFSTTMPLHFSHGAGFYTKPFRLTLSSALPGATIYYTVDGSVPDLSRVMTDGTWATLPLETRERTFIYTEPIDLAPLAERGDEITLIPTGGADSRPGWSEPRSDSYKSTVVRALAVGDSASSPERVNTYFIAPEGPNRYTLPVASIATGRSNLFAPETGIYVPGVAGQNYNQRGDEWERPVHIELFDNRGRRVLAQDAGIRIHGGFSRQFPQKAVRLYARAEYGASHFAYRFFESKTDSKFKRVIMRAGGNDNANAHLRDAALQTLVQHLSFETQHYQPLILFINGEYWGIHEFRDRYDDRHLALRYDLDRRDIAIIENDTELVAGAPSDLSAYHEFIARVREGGLRSRTDFDAWMDLDGYLDYIVTEMYAANTDWPYNNIMCWRYKGAGTAGESPRDGRWRWMLFDVDRSFGLTSTKDTDMVALLLTGTAYSASQSLFRGLMEVAPVRHEFLQRVAVHLATTFSPDRVQPHIDSLASLLEPEIGEHIRRWTRPGSFADWTNQIDIMLDFAADRPAIFRRQIDEYFEEVTGIAELRITQIRDGQGLRLHTVSLSESTPGVRITGGIWTGQMFTGVPVVLRAEHAGLAHAVISGDVKDVERGDDRLSFVMVGPTRIDLH